MMSCRRRAIAPGPRRSTVHDDDAACRAEAEAAQHQSSARRSPPPAPAWHRQAAEDHREQIVPAAAVPRNCFSIISRNGMPISSSGGGLVHVTGDARELSAGVVRLAEPANQAPRGLSGWSGRRVDSTLLTAVEQPRKGRHVRQERQRLQAQPFLPSRDSVAQSLLSPQMLTPARWTARSGGGRGRCSGRAGQPRNCVDGAGAFALNELAACVDAGDAETLSRERSGNLRSGDAGRFWDLRRSLELPGSDSSALTTR